MNLARLKWKECWTEWLKIKTQKALSYNPQGKWKVGKINWIDVINDIRRAEVRSELWRNNEASALLGLWCHYVSGTTWAECLFICRRIFNRCMRRSRDHCWSTQIVGTSLLQGQMATASDTWNISDDRIPGRLTAFGVTILKSL